MPTKAEREKWVREVRNNMTSDERSIMAGQLPAKLKSETAEMDEADLPALGGTPSAEQTYRYGITVAKLRHENKLKREYRDEKIQEIKNGLGVELRKAMENTALQAWKTYKDKG